MIIINLIFKDLELIYGLRNFIGNAVKFSRSAVEIIISSNESLVKLEIDDDGPGFPEDIKEVLGEPYINQNPKELALTLVQV